MQVVRLRELYEKYGERAHFLFVYIREAGHQFPAQLPDEAVTVDAPVGSRAWQMLRVRAGIEQFGLRFPCLLDNEEEEIQTLYSAYPKRLLVLDPAGRIVVDSGNAPNLPFPWQEMTDWLDHYDAGG